MFVIPLSKFGIIVGWEKGVKYLFCSFGVGIVSKYELLINDNEKPFVTLWLYVKLTYVCNSEKIKMWSPLFPSPLPIELSSTQKSKKSSCSSYSPITKKLLLDIINEQLSLQQTISST